MILTIVATCFLLFSYFYLFWFTQNTQAWNTLLSTCMNVEREMSEGGSCPASSYRVWVPFPRAVRPWLVRTGLEPVPKPSHYRPELLLLTDYIRVRDWDSFLGVLLVSVLSVHLNSNIPNVHSWIFCSVPVSALKQDSGLDPVLLIVMIVCVNTDSSNLFLMKFCWWTLLRPRED